MEIICLLENTTLSPALEARHGLSLFIQLKDRSLVFDLGPDHTALANARTLGPDLASADLAVISHGHGDHGGGLAPFLDTNPFAEVFLTQGAKGRFVARMPDQTEKEIGLAPGVLASAPCRFIDQDTVLSPDLSLFMCFDKTGFLPRGNAALFTETPSGELVPDPFDHELALLAREGEKTVLFTGCSHSGIANMVGTVLRRTGLPRIDVVVGGFHLFNPLDSSTEPRDRLDSLARDLSAWPDTVFYTGHCTGAEGFRHLNAILGNRIRPLSTGTRI